MCERNRTLSAPFLVEPFWRDLPADQFEIVSAADGAGADELMTKPFRTSDIRPRLGRLLASKRKPAVSAR
jgi:hypothetical protein